ncbi:hypothetical protein D3C86_1035280 [compost metagenome]
MPRPRASEAASKKIWLFWPVVPLDVRFSAICSRSMESNSYFLNTFTKTCGTFGTSWMVFRSSSEKPR